MTAQEEVLVTWALVSQNQSAPTKEEVKMDIVLRVLVFVACSGESFNWLLHTLCESPEI